MRATLKIYILLTYFAFILAVGAMLMPRANAYMEHDKIMQGFITAQKAPQMGRPMIYLPKSKVFPGKRGKLHEHKKGHK